MLLSGTNRFEPRALPKEAQLAPAMGVAVQDFDGDGELDVFVAQNFFAFRPELPRGDSGHGLLLRGKGEGRFHALTPLEAGITVFGEQRGVAAADLDGDGAIELIVSQNGLDTRLFRSGRSRSGKR